MKANKVLKKLNITRRTLSTYVKQKKIKVIKLKNGFYDYDDNDVMLLEKNTIIDNSITICINGKKIDFILKKDDIKDILFKCIELSKN